MVKKSVRTLIVPVVVAVIAGGGIMLVKHKKQTLAQAPRYGMQPTPVRVASARLGDLQITRDYLAVVEPIRSANVSARLTANVEKVLHDENARVKAGDVLVVLDSREIAENVSFMTKTYAYWEREARRDKTLAEKGAIPGAQAEGTFDKANEAGGRLAAAKTQLSYCLIRSPFDGLVSHRMVDPGDLAAPGKNLMVVEDRDKLKLCFDVPQQDLPLVRAGLQVAYSVSGKERTATLSHLFPSLSAARMLRAEVYLDGADMDGLSSGAYVPLRVILGDSRDVTLVPAGSVVESPDGKPHVFIVRDGRLEARPVSILNTSGDEVAVEGVQAGEQVVLSTFLGWAQLSSGQMVEVMK
uniref:Efflux RND transporter periplasmic adaptor subunit n=1 Tax=Candidatus Desulfatibia profunda TaxID=2841695 RepID=A0A8J6NWW5_9BACT|nr:efflux RND transporter periplasmic adaptor subunit [Candidatus Desulfatibia profunda]